MLPRHPRQLQDFAAALPVCSKRVSFAIHVCVCVCVCVFLRVCSMEMRDALFPSSHGHESLVDSGIRIDLGIDAAVVWVTRLPTTPAGRRALIVVSLCSVLSFGWRTELQVGTHGAGKNLRQVPDRVGDVRHPGQGASGRLGQPSSGEMVRLDTDYGHVTACARPSPMNYWTSVSTFSIIPGRTASFSFSPVHSLLFHVLGFGRSSSFHSCCPRASIVKLSFPRPVH